MAPRSFWKDYLRLSHVTCRVAMVPATSTRQKVRFHTLNRDTGNRVESRYVDVKTGKPVREQDQHKGYAKRIAATEGREVRSYEKNPTPDRVRDQNKARKQAQRRDRTPTQIEADRKRDRERKAAKRKAEKTEAAAAMEAQALF